MIIGLRKKCPHYIMGCILIVCVAVSCSAPKKIVVPSSPDPIQKIEFDPSTYFDEPALRIYNMANQYPNSIQARMQNASKDSLQIRFTQITKTDTKILSSKLSFFQPQQNALIEANMMGKILLAIACANKMQLLKRDGLTSASFMITESAGKNLPGAYNDPYVKFGKPTVGQYLARMLMHNDIEAYNRLFEFITKDSMEDFLKTNGWNSTILNSRLGRKFLDLENASMNAIHFYDENNRKIFTQPSTLSIGKNKLPGYNNVTTLSDIESVLEAIFFDGKRGANLVKQIGEEQLEILKILLLNPQGKALQDASNKVIGSTSLFFPQLKTRHSLIIIPLQSITAKGMSEVLLYHDSNTGKIFLLSCSILFKGNNNSMIQEKEIKLGKAFFEDLGNVALSQG